jgi:putative transposase
MHEAKGIWRSRRTLLRQIELAVANGKTTARARKEAEIVEQTSFRWRKEYDGFPVDQAGRLKELERENARLKRLVAEMSLGTLVLKDISTVFTQHFPNNPG